MISVHELLAQLSESVELLAAPADMQIAWLRATKFHVDELALQLDDEVPHWFPRLTEAGLLTAKAKQRLVILNDALGEFSGPQNSALWTEEALYSAEQWAHVRELAGRALEAMNKASTE